MLAILSLAGSSERFSVAMTILNLVIRPVTSVVLWKIASERGGAEFANRGPFGDIFGKIKHAFNFNLFFFTSCQACTNIALNFVLGRNDTVAPGGRPHGAHGAYDDIDNPRNHQSVPGVVTVDGAGNKQGPPSYHG